MARSVIEAKEALMKFKDLNKTVMPDGTPVINPDAFSSDEFQSILNDLTIGIENNPAGWCNTHCHSHCRGHKTK